MMQMKDCYQPLIHSSNYYICKMEMALLNEDYMGKPMMHLKHHNVQLRKSKCDNGVHYHELWIIHQHRILLLNCLVLQCYPRSPTLDSFVILQLYHTLSYNSFHWQKNKLNNTYTLLDYFLVGGKHQIQYLQSILMVNYVSPVVKLK